MYNVEYLILLEKDKTKCKTVNALKNLLQSDSDIEIEKNVITHKKNYATKIIIKTGKKDSSTKEHLFFSISLHCNTHEEIEQFSNLLKTVRSSLNLITQNVNVILDDLNLFYAQKAYPIIFNIENLMRQIITKFMLTNVGVGWTKERVPTEVQQSINPSNKDLNFLNNVDFIQLKNFLFSENYPNDKDSLIKKLKAAKDFSNLDLDDIKSLLPESNWERFFEPIVGCEAEYLKKRWDKLYDLRCKVAHNKSFKKNDLEDVKTLSSELKVHFVKALNNLDKIVITEDERENIAEKVVISSLDSFHGFVIIRTIKRFHQLAKTINIISNHSKINTSGKKSKSFGSQTGILLDNGIINQEQYSDLKQIYYLRNRIVHFIDPSISNEDLSYWKFKIDELILFFDKYIQDNKL